MKNKFCPYKKVCRDMCYGENPSRLQRRLTALLEKST